MYRSLDGIGCLTGIAPWKRQRVQRMLANRCGPPIVNSPAKAIETARKNGGALACWPSRVDPSLPRLAHDAGVELWTIEDGFIRSAGLGAALVQPCSILLDRKCVHYDPSRPSDLETILQEGAFPREQCDRATKLIETIRRSNITKYNLAGEPVVLPRGRRIVLAVGQVEDDLSVLRGGCGLSMEQFLAQVRQAEPDALIVFKPHPDVAAGLRRGGLDEDDSFRLSGADICDLFEQVDAVHTLTSLAGFEALLRGIEVTVHGQPFYSGWGLTRDLAPVERRTRKLSLAELVAGTLIEYPIYCHPRSGDRCSVEELIEVLSAQGPAAMPGKYRNLLGRLAGAIGRHWANSGKVANATSADL